MSEYPNDGSQSQRLVIVGGAEKLMTSEAHRSVPMLLRPGKSALPLRHTKFGTPGHLGDEREAFIQNLVHEHPEIIPIADIEPAFIPLISVCRELEIAAGYLDNLWLTPHGGIVLGECKLFRNQESRREVIVQALHYAQAFAALSYGDLEATVRRSLKSQTITLWDLVRDRSELDEALFVDAVERNLRRSHFLVLVIGDGIREGVESLTEFLQLHAGLHFVIGLVDLSIWTCDDGSYLVVPRIPMRTRLIERGVVIVDTSGTPKVLPPKEITSSQSNTSPKPFTLSEEEFFTQLELNRPGLQVLIRSFLNDISEIGVHPDYGKSMILRYEASPDFKTSAGYIDTKGKVWLFGAYSGASQLGASRAGVSIRRGPLPAKRRRSCRFVASPVSNSMAGVRLAV